MRLGIRTRLSALAWEMWLPVVVVIACLVVTADSTSFYFPSFAEIFERTGELWFFDGIVENVVPSLLRILIGFAIALVVGIVGGIVLGLLPRFEQAVRPILEFLRATPGVALMPIAIIFLGIGDTMKIFLIALASMWPILLNTIDGVRSVEPVLLRMAASYRLPMKTRIRYIYVPNAAPQIFAGARLALTIATVVMVVTEMIGSPGGIGYFILDSQRSFNILNMWSGIVVLGVLGYLLNFGARLVEGRVLDWHNKKNA
ncbi:MAG TPA: ABC transporter permease [Nocardia sp.]|uniref:ABC transporter permease n=1 Tax=Nocardia TaxID=1817 RepID=UPI002454D5E9|nr:MULTISPECIES: ABC transporter permease [Nocardia]HLS76950.1 ABC transporter permease [Nocardia sp.]